MNKSHHSEPAASMKAIVMLSAFISVADTVTFTLTLDAGVTAGNVVKLA